MTLKIYGLLCAAITGILLMFAICVRHEVYAHFTNEGRPPWIQREHTHIEPSEEDIKSGKYSKKYTGQNGITYWLKNVVLDELPHVDQDVVDDDGNVIRPAPTRLKRINPASPPALLPGEKRVDENGVEDPNGLFYLLPEEKTPTGKKRLITVRDKLYQAGSDTIPVEDPNTLYHQHGLTELMHTHSVGDGVHIWQMPSSIELIDGLSWHRHTRSQTQIGSPDPPSDVKPQPNPVIPDMPITPDDMADVRGDEGTIPDGGSPNVGVKSEVSQPQSELSSEVETDKSSAPERGLLLFQNLF